MDKKLQVTYAQIETLIAKMDLPSWRKKVTNESDVRWLSKHLKIKNARHSNYGKTITLINEIL